jgi:hypothetical protein
MKSPLHIRDAALKAAAVIALAIACGSLVANTTAARAATVIGNCNWSTLSLPFLALGDTNAYFPAPGGNFEGTTSGWTLSGGAQIVPGNESANVGGRSDSQSLSLPTTSSSATSPTMCVNPLSPTFRMYLLNKGNNGATDGQLAVYLNFTDGKGNQQQVKIAALKATPAWSPIEPIPFDQYLNSAFKQFGRTQVSFTFKPNDNHGNWQLDDLYIDPFKLR